MTLLCHISKGSISDGSAVVILRVVDGLFGSQEANTNVVKAGAVRRQGLEGCVIQSQQPEHACSSLLSNATIEDTL